MPRHAGDAPIIGRYAMIMVKAFTPPHRNSFLLDGALRALRLLPVAEGDIAPCHLMARLSCFCQCRKTSMPPIYVTVYDATHTIILLSADAPRYAAAPGAPRLQAVSHFSRCARPLDGSAFTSARRPARNMQYGARMPGKARLFHYMRWQAPPRRTCQRMMMMLMCMGGVVAFLSWRRAMSPQASTGPFAQHGHYDADADIEGQGRRAKQDFHAERCSGRISRRNALARHAASRLAATNDCVGIVKRLRGCRAFDLVTLIMSLFNA